MIRAALFSLKGRIPTLWFRVAFIPSIAGCRFAEFEFDASYYFNSFAQTFQCDLHFVRSFICVFLLQGLSRLCYTSPPQARKRKQPNDSLCICLAQGSPDRSCDFAPQALKRNKRYDLPAVCFATQKQRKRKQRAQAKSTLRFALCVFRLRLATQNQQFHTPIVHAESTLRFAFRAFRLGGVLKNTKS